MTAPARQLVVQGGGGFLMEKGSALDRHFLAVTGKRCPRVCFVGTASGDAESARYKFYEAMAPLDCRATHLSLVQPPTADLASFVLEQDAVYVGGGNTRTLLAVWREWGSDPALRAAYERAAGEPLDPVLVGYTFDLNLRMRRENAERSIAAMRGRTARLAARAYAWFHFRRIDAWRRRHEL